MGGGGGAPTYVPQNDPHDALIIWNRGGGGSWTCEPFFSTPRPNHPGAPESPSPSEQMSGRPEAG